MKTKRSSRKGPIEKIYEKTRDVVGTVLAGAATGTVSGSADSAKKVAGAKETSAQPGVAGKGKGRTSVETKTKQAASAKKASSRTTKASTRTTKDGSSAKKSSSAAK